jgi:hypothetical protein
MSCTLPPGFKEVQPPTLFKFEAKGTELHATLLKNKTERINGDAVLELYFKLKTGKIVRVRPGFDLRSKLDSTMIGKEVFIVYVGDDHERGKDGNALKVFDVFVKEVEPNLHGVEITDDDIPF